MEKGATYHIYNRGINSTNIFFTPGDYNNFLERYREKMSLVADTLAFCLLPNHFHFVIQIKEELPAIPLLDNQGKIVEGKFFTPDTVKQLSHVCNGYVQAVNKLYNRHGGLLETPFQRKEIQTDAYMAWCIWYVHRNPQHHQLVDDFRKWPYSSYHATLAGGDTIICIDKAIQLFGSIEAYQKYHTGQHADFEDKHFD